MASGIGQTEANTILNSRFQNSASTGPATIFCALHSVVPTDTTQGTEAAYTSYARQSITCNTTNFPTASAGAITYGLAVTFPTSTGGSETEVAASWQALSSGGTQPLYWGSVSAPQLIATGNQPAFLANALVTSAV